MVPSTREGNQIATDSLKGQGGGGLEFAAGADGNGRDRSLFTWRDRVLAETGGGTSYAPGHGNLEAITEGDQSTPETRAVLAVQSYSEAENDVSLRYSLRKFWLARLRP